MSDPRWDRAARRMAQATRGKNRDLNLLKQASEDCLAAALATVEGDPRAELLQALGREAALERELAELKRGRP